MFSNFVELYERDEFVTILVHLFELLIQGIVLPHAEFFHHECLELGHRDLAGALRIDLPPDLTALFFIVI